jgi:transcriptional regulator with XRE-family HTH domain
MPMMTTIERIRRHVFDLSQEEFARAVGRAQSTVSRWETGEFPPRLDDLAAIRKAARDRHLPWDDQLFFVGGEAVENSLTGP